MSTTLLTPAVIWQGFDPSVDALHTEIVTDDGRKKTFVFTAEQTVDGAIRVGGEFYSPDFASRKNILIVGEYEKKPQENLLSALTDKGYNVLCVDYSGVWHHTLTQFTEKTKYGYFAESGDHLTMVCPTAKETCYFLYAKIIRRAITLLRELTSNADTILVGIKSGGDIALQAAGTDRRIVGLGLIATAGYREYLGYPKYGGGKEPVIDEKKMDWFIGASGLAYVKHVKAPVFIALGSNGTQSDVDRVSNFITLMPDNEVRLTICAGLTDNIDFRGYQTFLQWLESAFFGGSLPELPTMNIRENSEGVLFGDIKTDACINVKKVKAYYAFDDFTHSTRYWREAEAVFVGESEYIAKFKIGDTNRSIFAFCEVEYVNGLVLSGVVNYMNLTDNFVQTEGKRTSPIVFQYAESSKDFIETSEYAVIMENGLTDEELPIGLKGLKIAQGGMISYSIGTKKGMAKEQLLQIDAYTALAKDRLDVTLVKSEDGGAVEYCVTREIETTESFYSIKLTPNDFKDENFAPMEDWEDVKMIKVKGGNVVIGKILFI